MYAYVLMFFLANGHVQYSKVPFASYDLCMEAGKYTEIKHPERKEFACIKDKMDSAGYKQLKMDQELVK